MRVNRKFDFRSVLKFCWDLSNVISGGKWLFRWDCVFSGGTLYPSANYVYIVYIYYLEDTTTFYSRTDVFKHPFFSILLQNGTSLLGQYSNVKQYYVSKILC